MEQSDTSNDATGRRPKVVRLIDEYGLDDIGLELERRWTASGDERMSLRALADHFNQRLMVETMVDAGLQPLAGEAENLYRLLTGDDASEAERTRARRRLERDGVDVEMLLGDFVTYQAVRTYLRDHRGLEYEVETGDRLEAEGENIRQLRGRTSAVVESKLEQLRTGNDLVLGKFRTFVDVNVYCEDCGRRYEVNELLERRGCNCRDSSPA